MSQEAKLCAIVGASALALWVLVMVGLGHWLPSGERFQGPLKGRSEAHCEGGLLIDADGNIIDPGGARCPDGSNGGKSFTTWTSPIQGYSYCQMNAEGWYEYGNVCHSDPGARR
jgi:hypothetical protein